MAEHPNVALIRQAYDAFSKGDMATVSSLWYDDIVWHEPGDNQLSGTYKGQDEVFALLGRVFEITGGTFAVTVEDVFANDDYGVVITTVNASRGDRTATGTAIDVMRIRDGRTAEFWANVTNAPEWEALLRD